MKHIIIALAIAALLMAGCGRDTSRCGLAQAKGQPECMMNVENIWQQ